MPLPPHLDPTAMRCPRCLERWDPDWLDLGAEIATCARCDLSVSLLGAVVPEWQREAIALRLDAVGEPPAGSRTRLTEKLSPPRLEARARGLLPGLGSRLTLGHGGVLLRRFLRRPRSLQLREIARIVPVARFWWEEPNNAGWRILHVGSEVVALAQEELARRDPLAVLPPGLPVPSWDEARFVAARFERVRRALAPRSAYR